MNSRVSHRRPISLPITIGLVLSLYAPAAGGACREEPLTPPPARDTCRLEVEDSVWTRVVPCSNEWIRLKSATAERWRRVPVGDSRELVLEPPGEPAGPRVLVLVPKPSLAYDLALSRLLDDLAERRVDATVSVRYWNLEPELARVALKEARRNAFDLIFSMGSQSTLHLRRHFPGRPTPVVTLISKDPVRMGQMPGYTAGSGENFAYTSLDVPIDTQITYLQELRPRLRQIAVLYARDNISARCTQVEPLEEAGNERGIDVMRVEVVERHNARRELAAKVDAARRRMLARDPGGSHSLFWMTSSTAVFAEISVINRFAGPIPVLSVTPSLVNGGDDSPVLSIGVSYESNTDLAVIYALRILRGHAVPGDLPVGLVSPPDISISFRKAAGIGLRIPFLFFESAAFIYDEQGREVRSRGRNHR